MKTKTDIQSPQNIKFMVDTFYEKVKLNAVLSPYFIDLDWPNHLEKMYKFWENIAFYSGEYNGNPMEIHKKLNESKPLFEEAFQNWITLFNKNIDLHFEGPKVEQIKQRAQNIAQVMIMKIIK
jgi:hemoglobin